MPAVGLVVGAMEGDLVGDLVGILPLVGLVVGNMVGDLDGIKVGEAVGKVVGDAEGDLVGKVVGIFLLTIGAAVGNLVEVPEVGAAGDKLGANVAATEGIPVFVVPMLLLLGCWVDSTVDL